MQRGNGVIDERQIFKAKTNPESFDVEAVGPIRGKARLRKRFMAHSF